MAPKGDTELLEQLSDAALEGLGMSPSFITDFDRFKELKDVLDFTKVDRDAAQNLLHTAGQLATKKAFETAGDAVDKGLQVVAGVLGATGQWYGTAVALVGEEALDLAESYFENWMGWTGEEPEPEVGEWVLIDMGRRRMLDADAFTPVSAEEQELAHLHGRRLPSQTKPPLKHATHLGLLMGKGPDADGRYNLFDSETGGATHPRRQGYFLLSKDENAELNAMPNMVKLKALAFQNKGGFADQVDMSKYAKVGDRVSFEGRAHTVTNETSQFESRAFIEDNETGLRTEVRFDDPRLETDSWVSSSFRPYDGQNPRAGFVQAAGWSAGMFAWRGRDQQTDELVVVQALKANSGTALYVSCVDGRSDNCSIGLLRAATPPNDPVFQRFAQAVVSFDAAGLRDNLPNDKMAWACQDDPTRTAETKFVPYGRRGRPEGPTKQLSKYQDPPMGTPGLAKILDENRERLEVQNKRAPEYWDTSSAMSWGAPQALSRPTDEPASQSYLFPLLAAGAVAAFVVTR